MSGGSFIYLRWIGTRAVEFGMLDLVKAHAEEVFRTPARVMDTVERPPEGYDPTRRQYSSTKILRWLLREVPADASKVVGITDEDLFIPVLTFVFGEAQLGGTGAVVSTARLGVNLDGSPCTASVFRGRLLKECAHELGHTFGLAHCSLPRCVMSRSNTVLEVDAKTSDLCRDCRVLLRDVYRKQE